MTWVTWGGIVLIAISIGLLALMYFAMHKIPSKWSGKVTISGRLAAVLTSLFIGGIGLSAYFKVPLLHSSQVLGLSSVFLLLGVVFFGLVMNGPDRWKDLLFGGITVVALGCGIGGIITLNFS